MDEINILGHPFQRMQKGTYECHTDDVLLDVMKMTDGRWLFVMDSKPALSGLFKEIEK